MRNKFANTIHKLGSVNKKVCMLVADISPAGAMVDFQKKFPKRFINTGVAEQSMIGIAAGLALKGFKPFCYTIATFSIFRPYEFVRVDLCYQKLPVTIVGMGAGLIYSNLGSTHQSIEDISLAKSLPNMTVIAPCDPNEMELATRWCIKNKNGPVYMRLGKAGEPNLTENAVEKFKIGKIRKIENGKKICIISYGTILSKAFEIKKFLNKKNFYPSIYNCHTLKPLDIKTLKKIFKKYAKIIVYEECVENGSLGEQIKKLAFDNKFQGKILSKTIKDKFIKHYGTYEDILDKHDLSSKKIIKSVAKFIIK